MKVSEVIKNLQELQNTYGDLKLTISASILLSDFQNDFDNQTYTFDNLYFGYDQISDTSEELSIRNFSY